MASGMSKLQKRRLAILGTISVMAISLAIFTSVSFYISIHKLDRHYKELSTILEALKDDERELKNDMKKLSDPEYIAKYARENYLYSKEGEYVIKLEEDELVVEETVSSKRETLIQSTIITLTLVVVVLLILRIRKFAKQKKNNE